jgi:hypothetical protein
MRITHQSEARLYVANESGNEVVFVAFLSLVLILLGVIFFCFPETPRHPQWSLYLYGACAAAGGLALLGSLGLGGCKFDRTEGCVEVTRWGVFGRSRRTCPFQEITGVVVRQKEREPDKCTLRLSRRDGTEFDLGLFAFEHSPRLAETRRAIETFLGLLPTEPEAPATHPATPRDTPTTGRRIDFAVAPRMGRLVAFWLLFQVMLIPAAFRRTDPLEPFELLAIGSGFLLLVFGVGGWRYYRSLCRLRDHGVVVSGKVIPGTGRSIFWVHYSYQGKQYEPRVGMAVDFDRSLRETLERAVKDDLPVEILVDPEKPGRYYLLPFEGEPRGDRKTEEVS